MSYFLPHFVSIGKRKIVAASLMKNATSTLADMPPVLRRKTHLLYSIYREREKIQKSPKKEELHIWSRGSVQFISGAVIAPRRSAWNF